MPSLTIREIDQFFKTSGKTGKLHKRADALIYDSYLDNIECLNTNSFFYVRSICSASYSKNKLHKLSCAFDSSAQIVYSYCSCVAGKGGFCNHIYSLLKMLAQFVLDGLSVIPQKMACTSRPCGWTVPKVRKMNVQKPTVMETTIKKPRVQQQSKGIGCTLYEARAPEVQGFDQKTVMDMQNKLKETSSSIPIVYGLRNTTDKSDWVQTKFGLVPVFSPLAYQCSRFGNNFKVYVNIDVDLPPAGCQPAASHTYPTFPHSPIPQYFEQDMSELLPSSQVTLQGLNVTALEAVQLEEATRSQSSSSLWHDERKKRVTASKVYEISQWKRCMENHADKYVNSSSSLSASNPVLQRKLTHGTMYEPVAWEKYKLCMQDESVEVYPCGLVVDPNNSWLGCSPDARLVAGGLFGIGESKCPEQYKHNDIFDTAKTSDNFMLCVSEGERLEVRKTHAAYYQVQCQLALSGAQFCDLVVYTFQSLAVIRITFDKNFWQNLVKKVGKIYFQYILPKLM